MSNALLTMEETSSIIGRLKNHIQSAIFGQEELILEAMCCLIGSGHILLTGAPGLAKTTLVRVFAHALGLKYGRIQFTPDLLPSDILGSEILNLDDKGQRHFTFAMGPVFANLLLADEINRASPRTQSALLEAMQERAVTVNGKRSLLPSPFLVFATQNPFESEGTFPLPEAQLDRFLMHTLIDYPTKDAEKSLILSHSSTGLFADKLSSENSRSDAISSQELNGLIERANKQPIDDNIIAAITDLVRSTRPSDPTCPTQINQQIWYGAGPRAGLALVTASKALSLIQGMESVRWSHVKRVSKPVLRHRLRLKSQALRDGATEDQLIDHLIDRIQIDRMNQGIGLDSGKQ
jgi:MoxR-like ATPase